MLSRFLFLSSFLSLFLWALPAWAADPDLIDVLEITDTHNPIIVHENILPGDSFSDVMTIENKTADTAFDIGMYLDIDTTQGIIGFPDYRLERKITVKIQRSDSSFVTLPNGLAESSLHDLDEKTIALGSLPAGATEVYTVLAYFDINAGNEYQNTKVYFNLDMGVEILGETPRLLLTKVNDSVSDEVPGSEVVYTLAVTAVDGPVSDVTLTDLPPAGFAYVPGSGTGAPFIHEYASPGVWDLGDFDEGETKTVSYTTTISSDQDSGLYRDLAFARGVSDGSATIYANGAENPFVSTAVNVVQNDVPTVLLEQENKKERQEKTKTKVQYVLGATLPLTGTPLPLVLGALALVVIGGGLLFWAKRQKQLLKSLVLCFGLGLLGLPTVTQAAGLSVKIETPEATVTTAQFKIGFATLDVLGRDLVVECYTTGSAVPFASYTLESLFGGNAGDCEVTSAVVPAEGSYEFFVQAKTTSGSPETVESEHVIVTVATTFPGTPTNYDRHDASCQNTITFRTADDGGKTVKVELYRGTTNPFVADATTKVAEQLIGSGTSGSFVEAAPGCSNDPFYAVRAVAANGNGSSFVGDVDVDTKTVTTTHTKTKTVTVPGASSGALPAAVDSNNGSAQSAVEGASTDVPSSGETMNGEAEVLGEATTIVEGEQSWWDWFKKHPWYSLGGLFLILFLARYGYRSFGTRSKNSTDEAGQ